MTIGQLACQAGLRTSAIRYYESVGLLESARANGRRQFSEGAAARLKLITAAKNASFSLSQIREILAGKRPNWRGAAESKLKELDETIVRATKQKEAVRRMLGCTCETIAECAERTGFR